MRSDQCRNQPAPDGTACNDAVACTASDVCRAGICGGVAISACVSGDGCCPSSCAGGTTDVDCPSCVNLAPNAIASSSGGGTNNFGPAKMNDGIDETTCTTNHWVSNSTTLSGWIELDWPAPVRVGSLYIETPSASGGMTCSVLPGRNIASAVVEYWNGSSWVAAATLSGQTDNVKTDVSPAVMTSKLRLNNILSGTGNGNSIIYEWYVYSQSGCVP